MVAGTVRLPFPRVCRHVYKHASRHVCRHVRRHVRRYGYDAAAVQFGFIPPDVAFKPVSSSLQAFEPSSESSFESADLLMRETSGVTVRGLGVRIGTADAARLASGLALEDPTGCSIECPIECSS